MIAALKILGVLAWCIGAYNMWVAAEETTPESHMARGMGGLVLMIFGGILLLLCTCFLTGDAI